MPATDRSVPGCRLHRRTDLADVPARLRHLAYVFSSEDRIVGAYGRLLRGEDGELFVGDLLVCATQVRARVDDVDVVPLLAEHLGPLGWTAAGDHGLRRGAWRLRALPADAGALTSHVVLSLGDGHRLLQEHLDGPLRRHAVALLTRPAPGVRRDAVLAADLEEVVQSLGGRRLLVHTGAGISVASAVPAFRGAHGLDSRLGLEDRFPGRLVASMAADPGGLARDLGGFHASLLEAEPNDVHVLLAQLEAAGVVRAVVTSNLDGLHEAAGSATVVDARSAVDLDPDDVLLVLGLSADECGLVAKARTAGATVVVVDPLPPSYLRSGDTWVQVQAQPFVRALARALAHGSPPGPVVPLLPKAAPSVASPSIRRLLSLDRWTSAVHGLRHAQETAWLGLHLLAAHPEADAAVVLRFALLHDSARRTDGHDPEHGRRAAACVLELPPEALGLSAAQAQLLAEACAGHADATTTTDPTVAVCWDADRLGLWRLGVPPQHVPLSLPASRVPEVLAWARRARRDPPGWPALEAAFTACRPSSSGAVAS